MFILTRLQITTARRINLTSVPSTQQCADPRLLRSALMSHFMQEQRAHDHAQKDSSAAHPFAAGTSAYCRPRMPPKVMPAEVKPPSAEQRGTLAYGGALVLRVDTAASGFLAHRRGPTGRARRDSIDLPRALSSSRRHQCNHGVSDGLAPSLRRAFRRMLCLEIRGL